MAKVFLIHGWSVRSTTTYRSLHKQLERAGYDLQEVQLGRYVSLDNDIELRDISRALHNELVRQMGRPPWSDTFHMITHSTGALVVKNWILEHYVDEVCEGRPLKNLIFLAGPHFGSRLAHHGRSMLAYAIYLGDTGRKILTDLELGSEFSWSNNEGWLDPANWKAKGIRPFCLIGDKVKRSPLKSRIFPAGYEAGSDMVVRAAAGNLNFRRYELIGASGRFRKFGEIKGVPFASLWRYVHSGEDAGIMNSIRASADPADEKYQNLRLILDCLSVGSPSDYAQVRRQLNGATAETATKRNPYAQLDFRFRDESGAPIDDYRFTLGYFDGAEKKASDAVEDVHKNQVAPNHFTAFIRHDKLDPKGQYFLEFLGETDSPLFDFEPSPLARRVQGVRLQSILAPNTTTQIDVIMRRESARQLFVFHPGDDDDLHVKWNRSGEITRTDLPIK